MSSATSSTKVLNDLIEICKDGQEGFREAAEKVKTAELKTLFSQYSLQRSKFAGELQQLVIGLGEKEEETSSITSALHRGWINLKSALTSGDDHSILAECERGEDHAVAYYREALDGELPSNIRSVVASQYDSVLETHNDVRDRRNALA